MQFRSYLLHWPPRPFARQSTNRSGWNRLKQRLRSSHASIPPACWNYSFVGLLGADNASGRFHDSRFWEKSEACTEGVMLRLSRAWTTERRRPVRSTRPRFDQRGRCRDLAWCAWPNKPRRDATSKSKTTHGKSTKVVEQLDVFCVFLAFKNNIFTPLSMHIFGYIRGPFAKRKFVSF